MTFETLDGFYVTISSKLRKLTLNEVIAVT